MMNLVHPSSIENVSKFGAYDDLVVSEEYFRKCLLEMLATLVKIFSLFFM